jgi:hypothetical protein
MSRTWWLAVTAGVSLLADAQARTAIERTVYFTATNQHGVYVDDLAPTDLTVTEAGRNRTILRVGRSNERLKISLAIDEGLSPDTDVRRAASVLIERLQDSADIALYLVGSGTAKMVGYTSNPQLFQQALNGIPHRPQGGGNVVESLYQIAGDTRRVEGRRVIIILTTETPQRSGMTAGGVLDQLRDTGTVLYAATLVGPAAPIEPPTPEMAHLETMEDVERERVLNEGPKQSGGLRLSLLRMEAFPAALDRFRAELLHQCTVTYVMPAGSTSDGRLTLAAKRKGVTIRGPRQLPRI